MGIGPLELSPIHGRENEIISLRRLGVTLTGAGLLLDGEPGIGKSALLGAIEAGGREAGVRVVALTAVPGRSDRPLRVLDEIFTALDQHAELTAESLEEMVAAALAAAARQRPTLLILDDADRVDAMSWDALTRAARLLHDAPIALAAALPIAGTTRARESGLPVLTVGPIDREASEAVLDDVAPGLPRFVRHRLLEASAGNPLALRELASAPLGEWQRRCVRAPVALPLTPRLTSAFADLAHELPIATQEVLLAAAANDSQSLAEAARAAAITLDVSIEETLTACLPAVQQRLVECDSATLRFRSEVARSAIYQAASLARRRKLHLAFTEVLKDTPARGAWHRAAASLEPDEHLARELEDAAVTARSRGRLDEALAMMERAARVSEVPSARTDRLLRVAELGFEIGRADFAVGFAEQASGLAETSDQRRQVTSILGLYDLWRPDGPGAVLDLLALAEQAARDGNQPTTRTLLTRTIEKLGVLTPAQVPRDELVASAQRLGGLQQTPALVGPLALALPVEYGREILDLVAAMRQDADGDPRLARLLGEAVMTLGDDAAAVGSFSAAVKRMRLEGRFGLLPFALLDRARAYIGTAGLELARIDAAEAAELAGESAQPVLLCRIRAVQAVIEGLAGNPQAARALADEAERIAVDRPAMLVDVYLARGLTSLVCADYEDAFAWLIRLWDPSMSLLATGRRWCHIGDLAEAAMVCGELATVGPMVDELAITASAVPSPGLRAAVAHARAVIGSGSEESAGLFIEARDAAVVRGPLATGRVRLSYGIWLRRHRQVAEARLELRSALAAFDSVGADPWSDRARNELRAAGSAVASVSTDADELTAQERQIAELAAAGLSNREIGLRLYLSHRTVSTHLYHVFPKLGITSRAQLRDVLVIRGHDPVDQQRAAP
jgi:DNA-binding CsgD family transcriptional regulator